MINRNLFFWLTVGLLFFVFLYLIRGILLPFVAGALVAYLLDPAADRLERWRLSRTMATVTIITVFFLALLVFCLAVPPVLADQLIGLIAVVPEYVATLSTTYGNRFSEWLGLLPASEMRDLQQAASGMSGTLVRILGEVAAGLFQSGAAVFNVLALLVITPVVTFYLLRDWDHITAKIDSFLPRRHADSIREQLRLIDLTLSGFVRGQLNVCLLLGLFYAVGLSLTGLNFGIVIGMLSGLLVIVPYAGAAFAAVLGMGVAFFQFDDYASILSVLAVFIAGQALEGYVLTPNLVGSRVGLHPLWLIFGMLAGGALFGFVGVLLAVPVTAVIGVLIRFAISRYLQSAYYRG